MADGEEGRTAAVPDFQEQRCVVGLAPLHLRGEQGWQRRGGEESSRRGREGSFMHANGRGRRGTDGEKASRERYCFKREGKCPYMEK